MAKTDFDTAAQLLGFDGERALRTAIQAGRITAEKRLNSWEIDVDSLVEFAASRSATGRAWQAVLALKVAESSQDAHRRPAGIPVLAIGETEQAANVRPRFFRRLRDTLALNAAHRADDERRHSLPYSVYLDGTRVVYDGKHHAAA